MGKRAKKEQKTIIVASTNKKLKELDSVKCHRQKVIRGLEKKTEEELRKEKLVRDSFINLSHLPKKFERTQYISDIVACGYDVNDVIEMSKKKSDDELKNLVQEASNVYQDVETGLDFRSSLTNEQIVSLLPVMNELIFVEIQSLESVKRWLCCTNTEPVQVRNNGLLGYLLRLLSYGDYICSNWQKVAEENKVFSGSQGNVITQKEFSKALSSMQKRIGNTILNEEIKHAVDRLRG